MSDWDDPKDELEEKPVVEGDAELDLPEIPDEDEDEAM